LHNPNPKRLQILDITATQEINVSGIVKIMKLRKSGVSQHLALLRKAGLVISNKKGKNVHYKAVNSSIITLTRNPWHMDTATY
jgi:DNA-binding transcriptional ArsR family regulator